MMDGLAFLGLFLAWAWFGHIEEVSHAQGKLVPEGEVYSVQPIMRREIQSHASAATNQQIIKQLESDIHAHESRIERLRPLAEAGALTKEYLFDAEQELSNSQQAFAQHQGEVNQLLAENRQLQAGLSQKQSEGQRRELEIQQKIQELQIEADQLQAQITETQTVLGKAETEMKQLVLYAPVDGIVSTSLDAIEDEHLGAVYQLEIALDQDYVKHGDQFISLNAGQTATAEIIIRKQRIINIIFDPIRQL